MKKIPHVKEEDISRWEISINKNLPTLVDSIKLGKTQNGGRYYQLYREYRSLASVYFVRNDILKARGALLDSAKAYDVLLEKYQLGEQVKSGFISYTDYQAMLLPLICGDIDLAKSIASKFEKQEVQVNEHRFFVELAYAIKNAILGERDLAIKHSQNAIDAGFPNFCNFALLLSAILQDKAGLDDLLAKCLDEFDTSIKAGSAGLPEACIFLDGLGVISLYNYVYSKKMYFDIEDERLDIGLMA